MTHEKYVREHCPNLEVHYAPRGKNKWMLAFDSTASSSPLVQTSTESEMWRRAYESLEGARYEPLTKKVKS